MQNKQTGKKRIEIEQRKQKKKILYEITNCLPASTHQRLYIVLNLYIYWQ